MHLVHAMDDNKVYVYDSLYVCVNQAIKNQVAALLATKRKETKLKFMDVQIQSGGYDCGLFAVAYTTAIVLGYKLGKFFFDQSAMRRHLKNCFESQNMSLFPVKKTRQGEGKVKCEDYIQMFCKCRMSQLPGVDMVQCSTCDEWFHVSLCVCTFQSYGMYKRTVVFVISVGNVATRSYRLTMVSVPSCYTIKLLKVFCVQA